MSETYSVHVYMYYVWVAVENSSMAVNANIPQAVYPLHCYNYTCTMYMYMYICVYTHVCTHGLCFRPYGLKYGVLCM